MKTHLQKIFVLFVIVSLFACSTFIFPVSATETVPVHVIFFGEGGTYRANYETETDEEHEKVGVDKSNSGFFEVLSGKPITLTATPAEGYGLKGWYTTHEVDGSQWVLDYYQTSSLEYSFIPENDGVYLTPVFATAIPMINIITDTTSVTEGILPEYTVSTNTDHASIDAYGSNTGWAKRSGSSWIAFGSETPAAVADESTHYALRLAVNLDDNYAFRNDTAIYFNNTLWNSGYTEIGSLWCWGAYVYIDLGTASAQEEPTFTVVYDFNGGNRNGATTFTANQPAYVPILSTANFIDWMRVTPPDGMVLDALEINGKRYELGSYYELNKDTTFKYLWKENTYLKKESDGKYYYIKKGVKTIATLLFKHTDGKWYYVKDGVVTKSTLLFKHTDGKYYYIKNGVKTNATLLFKHTDGKYYYIKNGVVTKSTLLFKHTDSKWYYIKNGVVTKSTLLFKHTDGKWYYIKNGVMTKSTLLFKHTDGKYYYIKNGVMTKTTLIYKYNGKGRYIKNGVWQSSFSGKVKIGGKTYTIKKGNVA